MKKSFCYICGVIFGFLQIIACDNNSNEEKICALQSKIQAYGIRQTRSTDNNRDSLVFSGDNIEWFNPKTREIKFKGIEPNTTIFPVYSKIEFRNDGKRLFTVSSFVTGTYSQIFYDLVIYYNREQRKYYLDDCYPDIYDVRNHEEVKQNIIKREDEWREFLNTLDMENRIKN